MFLSFTHAVRVIIRERANHIQKLLLKRDIAVSTVKYKEENDLRNWKAHVASIDDASSVHERNRMAYIQKSILDKNYTGQSRM